MLQESNTLSTVSNPKETLVIPDKKDIAEAFDKALEKISNKIDEGYVSLLFIYHLINSLPSRYLIENFFFALNGQ